MVCVFVWFMLSINITIVWRNEWQIKVNNIEEGSIIRSKIMHFNMLKIKSG